MYIKDMDFAFDANHELGGTTSDSKTSGNAVLEKVLSFTWHNEVTDIANWGLDFYVVGKYSKFQTKGCFWGTTSPCTMGGYYTSGARKDREGHNFWVGLRKELRAKEYVGAEYIYNSKYSGSTDSGSLDFANIYGTTGSKAYHVYATKHLNDALTLSVGGTLQKQFESFTGGVFGDGSKADITNTSFYTRFIANF